MFVRSFTAVAVAAGMALASSPAYASQPDFEMGSAVDIYGQGSTRTDRALPTDCYAQAIFINSKNQLVPIMATTQDPQNKGAVIFRTEYGATPLPGGIASIGYIRGKAEGEGSAMTVTRDFYVVDTTGALRILTTKRVGTGAGATSSVVSNALVKKDFGVASSVALMGSHLYALHTDHTFRRYPATSADPATVGEGVKLGRGGWGFTSLAVVGSTQVNNTDVHRFRGVAKDGKLNDVQIDVATGAAAVATVGSGWTKQMGMFAGSCEKSSPMGVMTVAVNKNNTATLWWDDNNKGLAAHIDWDKLPLGGMGRVFG